jgi:hypothetical protein
MKKIFLLFILFLMSVISYSQNKFRLEQTSVAKEVDNGTYIKDGREFIEKFTKANGIDLAKLAMEEPALRKTTAWNFSVGSKYSWWSLDRRPGTTTSFYQAASTCKAVGTSCYVFVEDSLWNTGKVDQQAVDNIRNAFDLSTPADPSKGIYQNNVEAFGNPPNVDGDVRIIIFILRIRDTIGADGGVTAGYFYSGNESTTAANSNKAEIYYMEGANVNLKTAGGISLAASITAHEFQHMIQWNYKRSNPHSLFFNEACSMIAEVINGYPIRLQNSFSNSSNRYLLNWTNGSELADYGRGARFMLYIKEQFGITAFKKFVQSIYSDMNAWNFDVLPAFGSRTFKDVLEDWFIANYLNDKTVDPKWGYDYPNLPRVAATYHFDPNISGGTGGAYKLSAAYIDFSTGQNLNITFLNSSPTWLNIKAIKTGASAKQVESVLFSQNYSVSDFGSTYSDVTFVVYQNDPNDIVNTSIPNAFTYSSTGVAENKIVEISYDTKEPAGIYGWSVGDSVAVGFDGYIGAKLDSIRVALRTLAPLTGGIWGVSSSSTALFGKSLAVPITAYGKVYNTVPYPIPWNNWAKVDLRSTNVDASSPFLVSFTVDGAYQAGVSTGPNRVMHAYEEQSNSLTYTTNGGVRRWFKFTVDRDAIQDSLIVYLIRAYVSIGTSDISEPIELLPTTYSLNQNYPNPFNPSTVISFQLPKQGDVEIKIYDAIGNEIKTLISEFRNAGRHNIMWNGDDNRGRKVSSGIYFYKISADNFSQTKKMVLMR